ncbi:MAG: DNA polymerase III subunit gamma/tau [Bacteroidaceae bacterium]|nr:DNA polymerase III subunit gamma/tau [Bacteroidaceae bacterium]
MENYIVSARKYRPMTFDTVVGQSALTTTLKNAIRNGKLAHAYLFCGPRGVGKTTCARIFAKTINCLSPRENGEACNECESCRAFNEQRSYNIHELDAASNNSVDDIRQLIEQVRIPPQIGKYKVFIIDEVHMLSTQAFNAFLKTLEEPPRHAIFILATTEKHKLLATILSRCQIYDFNRMSVDDIVAHLTNVAAKEGITCEPAALNVIAQKADGGMRDALSIFDQVASFCQGNITYQQTIQNLNVLDSDYYFRMTDYFLACGNGDPKAPKVDQATVSENITNCILTLNEILQKGFDGQHFINGLATHLRNLLVSRDAQTVKLIEASDDVRQRYQSQAGRCTPRFLYNAMRLCNDCDLQYKQSQNKRLLVELTLIEVAQTAQGEDVPGSGRSPKKKLNPIFAGVRPQAAAPAAAKAAPRPQQEASTLVREDTTPPYQTTRPAEPPARRVGRSFSIRQAAQPVRQQQMAQATELPVDTPAECLPLNSSSVVIAWKEFIERLPQEEAAMAQRMKGIEPTLMADNHVVEVIANNQLVEQELLKMSPRIERYISQRVATELKMQIRLRKATDKKVTYSPAEQFSIMCKENDVLLKLKEVFGLELV